MAYDPQELRRVMGCFATGVAVITTRDAHGTPYGLTANAVSSLSLTPPLVLVCVDKKAETFAHFATSKRFVLNILGEEQEALSRRFAVSGGDKFAGVAFRLGPLETAVLADALGHVGCRIVATHDAGDHVIHVGEVEHSEWREGRPLLFFRGKYHRLPPES